MDRSSDADPPCEIAFDHLCAMLNTSAFGLQTDDARLGIESWIAKWPHHIRKLSTTLPDLLHRMRRPSWDLVSSLELHADNLELADCKSLEEMNRLQNISHLAIRPLSWDFYHHGIRRTAVSAGTLTSLLRPDLTSHLRSLSLQVEPKSVDGCVFSTLLASGAFASLNALELRYICPSILPHLTLKSVSSIQELALRFGEEKETEDGKPSSTYNDFTKAIAELPDLIHRSSTLPQLSSLDLSGSRFLPNTITRAIESLKCPQLTHLNLAKNWCDRSTIRAICNAQFAKSLQCLILKYTGIGSDGLNILATCQLPSIRRLDLSRTRTLYLESDEPEVVAPVDPVASDQSDMTDSIASFASSPSFHRLSTLKLDASGLGADGAAHLAAAPFCNALTTLHIHSLSAAASLALFNDVALPRLRVLELPECEFEHSVFKRPSFVLLAAQLSKLDLKGSSLSANDISHLFSVQPFNHLQELDLRWQFNEEVVLSLLSCLVAPRLRSLKLASNGLSSQALRKLATWPGLQSVYHLDLSNNHFGDPGLQFLEESAFSQSLVSINLSNTGTSPDAESRLKNCRFLPLYDQN